MRMPSRSLSSRMSVMPSSRLSCTSSAIFATSMALLTMYGISVTTMRLTAVLHRLDLRLRAGDDAAAAGGVGVVNALAAEDDAAGREIRALDALHQLLRGHVRVVDHA